MKKQYMAICMLIMIGAIFVIGFIFYNTDKESINDVINEDSNNVSTVTDSKKKTEINSDITFTLAKVAEVYEVFTPMTEEECQLLHDIIMDAAIKSLLLDNIDVNTLDEYYEISVDYGDGSRLYHVFNWGGKSYLQRASNDKNLNIENIFRNNIRRDLYNEMVKLFD